MRTLCLEPDPLSLDIKQEFSERESLDPRPTYSLVPKIELKTEPDNTFQDAIDPLALNKDSEAHDISSHTKKIKQEEQCYGTSSISSVKQLPPAILTGELVPELKNDANASLLMETLFPSSLESYQSSSFAEQKLELEKFDTTLTQWSTPQEKSCTQQKLATQKTGREEIISNIIAPKLETNSHETKMLETSIALSNLSSKSKILSTSQRRLFQASKYGINPEMIIGLCDAPIILHSLQMPNCEELKENKLKQIKQIILRPEIQKPLKVDQDLAADDCAPKKKERVRKGSQTDALNNKNNSFTLISYPKPIAEPETKPRKKDCDMNLNKTKENLPKLERPGVTVKTTQVRTSSPLSIQQKSSTEKHHFTADKGWTNDKCEKVLGEVLNLTGHETSHFKILSLQREHSKKNYKCKCPKCPREFSSLHNYERHFLAHHTEYTCNDCSPVVSFSKKKRLRKHMIIVHLKTHKFTCKICGKILTKKQKKSHMSIHDRKNLQCIHCQKNFLSVQKLMDHVKIHTGNAAYPCRYCVKYFEKRPEYNKHLRSEHNNERNAICEYCGERFFNVSNLYTHTLIHTRKNLCTCADCGRQFVHKHQLAAHTGSLSCRQAAMGSKGVTTGKRQNKKLKPTTRNHFFCANCNDCFVLKRQLIAHLKTKICEAQTSSSPENTKSSVVDINSLSSTASSSKRTKVRNKENREVISKSKNPVVCVNCKESFLLKRQLTNHLKFKICENKISCSSENQKSSGHSHNIKPLAGRAKMGKKQKEKQRSTTRNQFPCANCDKHFSLERHLIVHLKTKICEAQTSNSLKNPKSAIFDNNTAPVSKRKNVWKKGDGER